MFYPSSRPPFIFNHATLGRTVLGAAVLLALTGCGGGGTSSLSTIPDNDTVNTDPAGNNSADTTTPVVTATGVFMDSAVRGLSYRSGSRSGVTGVDGAFTYEVGQPVVFTIGGVTLGSVSGKDIVTPIDLVANGTSTSTEVTNITRFLMMLDSDGKPGNGITISSAVQAAAANWSQPDFSLASDAFTNAVDSIVNDVSSADGDRLAALPLDADAQKHLDSTFNCAYSGAYGGTMSGGYSGNFAAMISGKTGKVNTIYYANTSNGFVGWTNENKVQSLSQDGALSFITNNPAYTAANADGTGAYAIESRGSLDWPGGIGGSWTHAYWGSGSAPAGDQVLVRKSGSFSGSRLSDSTDTIYRFTLRYKGVTSVPGSDNTTVDTLATWGVMTFGVDADNKVSGQVYNVMEGGKPLPVTGLLSGLNISITEPSSGDTLQVTLSKDLADLPQNVRLQANYKVGATTIVVNGRGCKLNPWLTSTTTP